MTLLELKTQVQNVAELLELTVHLDEYDSNKTDASNIIIILQSDNCRITENNSHYKQRVRSCKMLFLKHLQDTDDKETQWAIRSDCEDEAIDFLTSLAAATAVCKTTLNYNSVSINHIFYGDHDCGVEISFELTTSL